MLPKPLRAVWGNLNLSEIKQFGLLALASMFTLGPYWMLRSAREALFIDLVGVRWQPIGKIASFLFVIPLVLIYSKLIDYVRKEKLFYVIYPIYIGLFLLIALFSEFPNIAADLTISSLIPGSIVGWISYVIIESFGALAPALFWSFVASYTTTKAAKKGYGMIVSITQIGTISGSLFVANFSERLGLPAMIITATACIALVPFIIKRFLSVRGTTADDGDNNKKKVSPSMSEPFLRTNKRKTGFFEGLRLLLKQPYLFGIFIITTGYEVVGTILEYQMNLLAHEAYPTKEAFAAFYSRYGFFANGLALVFALFGTSFFLRKLGLRICLLIFPAATGIIICSTRALPILSVVFISMIVLKGLSYSLNNPSKEILYIPTSRDAKFKAKGWIDVFGQRSIKASGASINALLRKLAPVETITYTTPILLLLVSGWLLIAKFVGNKHHTLIEENKIVG